jgi:hypothetical protein
MAAGLLERSDLFADISARRPMEKKANVLKKGRHTFQIVENPMHRKEREEPPKVILYRTDQYMIIDAVKRERRRGIIRKGNKS